MTNVYTYGIIIYAYINSFVYLDYIATNAL